MNQEKIPTISSEAPEQPGMDYQSLRKEGLAHLQRLATKIWTDYNSHDPGLTTLEQFCYALTDLSYRTNYDMEDLLATTEGNPYRCLYSPAEILTTQPITTEDLRKMLVDIEGVQNAWIETLTYPNEYIYYEAQKRQLTFEQLEDNALKTKGFYRVLIQKDKEIAITDYALLQQVEKCIHSNRKLAEDFSEVRLLDTQKVQLKASIEIDAVADADLLLAQIYRATADYMSPYIRFYTLSEMLDSGKRIDEVMDGPVLQHGFIDTEEIKQLDKRTDLRVSDIVHEIMQVEGVKVIKDVSLVSEVEGEEQEVDWVLNLDIRKAPQFDAVNTEVILLKDGLEATVNQERVLQLFHQLKADTRYPVLEENDRNTILAEGDYLDIDDYHPFQNDFPTPYGIGEAGLASSDPQRKGQAKQLKAYLLFFEQLLANYFAQIAHFKDLMDFYNPDIKTYFAQTLSGLPGLEELLQNPDGYEEWLKAMGEDEGTTLALDRKNRFLDHLMARFCEDFTDYSLIVYGSVESDRYSPPEKQIADKQALLREYPENSAGRAHAYNYTRAIGEAINVSGLQKRLSNLLGIPNTLQHSLLQSFEKIKEQVNAVYTDVDEKDIYHLLVFGLSREHYRFNNDTNKIEISKRASVTNLYAHPSLGFTNPNILAVTTDDHDITNYEEDVDQLIAQWQQWNSSLEGFYLSEHLLLCPQTDRQGGTFLNYAYPITATERSKIGYGVRCTSPSHDLADGEEIELFDSIDSNEDIGTYNGTYKVYNVQKDYFEIEHTNTTAPSNQAKWVRTRLYQEPYSLQLSFVLPDWPARFRDTSFREFIEQSIRRETPAHIQPYIHWLSRYDDMPDITWTREEIKAYMDRLSIPYARTDTREMLLDKIPRQTSMNQWEADYFQWLQKKAIHTGTPNESWLPTNTQAFMHNYGIKVQPDDTVATMYHKTDSFLQQVERWKVLYLSGEPDKEWWEKDLRTFMDIFGIAYTADDTQQTLLSAIKRFQQNFQKWQLLKNTETMDRSWPIETLREWMDIFHVPYLRLDTQEILLQKAGQFQKKAPQWLNQKRFPDDRWTDTRLKKLMDKFDIPYTPKDTPIDLQQKIIRYDWNCRQRDLWCFSQPDDNWKIADLKLYMSGFGVEYSDKTTKEVCLQQIIHTEESYQQWALLKGAPGQWIFPEDSPEWPIEMLREFADVFDITYDNKSTKEEVVKDIQRFGQRVARRLEIDPNPLQYHAGKLLEYLKMGKTPPPYAFDEASTIQFNANQQVDLLDFDLNSTGNRNALNITENQTIEMWIKPSEIGGTQKLYHKSTANVYERILLSEAKLKYHYGDENTAFYDEVPTDCWTHLAVIRESDNVSFVVNGKNTDIALTIVHEADPGEPSEFLIGGTSTDPYTGHIAELRVWNTAKTPEEIYANMQVVLIGDEEGLQSYWKLNESLGNVALDSSVNANHGITAGFLSDAEITADLAVNANPNTIVPREITYITIDSSQIGVFYQLRTANNADWGEAKEGNGSTLIFEIRGLEQTETFNVLAVKTTDHQLNGIGQERAQLDDTVTITVNQTE